MTTPKLLANLVSSRDVGSGPRLTGSWLCPHGCPRCDAQRRNPRTSGAPLAGVYRSLAAGDPGEAALFTRPEVATPKDGQRSGMQDTPVSSGAALAPDYAMLRAEPGTDFAEWWERQ